MSHFSVAVFSRTPGNVETLLAPFNEQVAPGDPYAVFVRDESGQHTYWIAADELEPGMT